MCENGLCVVYEQKKAFTAELYKIAKMRQKLFIFHRRLEMTQQECFGGKSIKIGEREARATKR